MRVWFGKTDWHPDEQWLLEGYDHDRQATRNYALADIFAWHSDRAAVAEIVSGIYEHFKGGLYYVQGTALDSETETPLVVYRTLYGAFDLWVRPLEMFSERVIRNGVSMPRFRLVAHF